MAEPWALRGLTFGVRPRGARGCPLRQRKKVRGPRQAAAFAAAKHSDFLKYCFRNPAGAPEAAEAALSGAHFLEWGAGH
jgi:hypothetical protein